MIIIITIYFENIIFFHNRLGLDVIPTKRCEQLTSNDTLTKVNLITSRPVTIRQLSIRLHGCEFLMTRCPS